MYRESPRDGRRGDVGGARDAPSWCVPHLCAWGGNTHDVARKACVANDKRYVTRPSRRSSPASLSTIETRLSCFAVSPFFARTPSRVQNKEADAVFERRGHISSSSPRMRKGRGALARARRVRIASAPCSRPRPRGRGWDIGKSPRRANPRDPSAGGGAPSASAHFRLSARISGGPPAISVALGRGAGAGRAARA